MIHVFTFSKDKYAQIVFYLNELKHNKYIKNWVIFAYCKMNADIYVTIDSIFEEYVLEDQKRYEIFDISNNERVLCIEI